MASKAPGKAHRKGISLIEITGHVPDRDRFMWWLRRQERIANILPVPPP